MTPLPEYVLDGGFMRDKPCDRPSGIS
jgi:hypothetical protein